MGDGAEIDGACNQPATQIKYIARLLESSYEACLAHELKKSGPQRETQVAVPVVYEGIRLEVGYRLDLLVDQTVVVEIKSVEKVNAICHAQLISYLKLNNKNLELLINCNVVHLRDGIKRFVGGQDWKNNFVNLHILRG